MDYELNGRQLELLVQLSSSDFGVKVNNELENIVRLEFSGLRKNTVEEYFEFDFKNDVLSLKESKNGVGFLPFLNKGVKAEIVLEIPAAIVLKGVVTTVSGDLVLGDFVYDGKVESVSGDVFAGNIESESLKLKTVSGDISIASLKGCLQANGVSGDIKVNDGCFKELGLNSVSGDIDISGDFDLQKSAKLNTVSGDIAVNVKSYRSENEIYVNSLSGEVDVEGNLPKEKIVRKKKGKKEFKDELSGLKDTLKPLLNDTLKSTLGKLKDEIGGLDIKFSVEDDKKVGKSAEKDVDQSVGNQEKLINKVLDMLSDGKIDYDQAEKLINSLKGK